LGKRTLIMNSWFCFLFSFFFFLVFFSSLFHASILVQNITTHFTKRAEKFYYQNFMGFLSLFLTTKKHKKTLQSIKNISLFVWGKKIYASSEICLRFVNIIILLLCKSNSRLSISKIFIRVLHSLEIVNLWDFIQVLHSS
jgi:uncharacterized HAD superfamily protein